MLKLILPNAEQINPHAEPPWQRSEYDYNICKCIRFYLPENKLGKSVKLDWAEDHTNLFDKNKDNNELLFVYTDGSLSYDKGTCKTGYGVAAFRKGIEITTENSAMGEHVEVYDAEMKGLEIASKVIHNLFNNETTTLPSRIVISTDNTGAIQRIFQGSPGKAQTSSLEFRKKHIGPAG